MITIGLVTINYKNAEDTIGLLSSLKRIHTEGIKIRQYIVDNASNDGSQEKIKKAFPKIISLKSLKNLGFAGGNNQGIARALKDGCDYVLLINNDTTISDKSFFTKMLKIRGDIISPRVRYRQNGKNLTDYGGRIDYFFGRNTHYLATPKTSPDYYSGVCLMIKKRVFSKISGMDESYFLYYEDADFCLNAAKMGFQIKDCPNTYINHHLSSSTNKLGKKKLIILADSHLRFCQKHLPIYSKPLYLSYNLYLRLKTLI